MHQTTAKPAVASRRHGARAGLAAVAALAATAALPIVAGKAAGPVAPGFTHTTVDPNLAGGEPLVSYYSNATNGPDLVYTSHEGTTHLFRDGLISPDTSNICSTPQVPPEITPAGYACSYTNEVNVWIPPPTTD